MGCSFFAVLVGQGALRRAALSASRLAKYHRRASSSAVHPPALPAVEGHGLGHQQKKQDLISEWSDIFSEMLNSGIHLDIQRIKLLDPSNVSACPNIKILQSLVG